MEAKWVGNDYVENIKKKLVLKNCFIYTEVF